MWVSTSLSCSFRIWAAVVGNDQCDRYKQRAARLEALIREAAAQGLGIMDDLPAGPTKLTKRTRRVRKVSKRVLSPKKNLGRSKLPLGLDEDTKCVPSVP